MVKLSFVLVAAAAAVAPPTISLDLDESYKLKTPIYRKHDLGYVQPTGQAVKSRQDFTERCQANKDTAKTCALPKAKAYDHFDRKVAVQARLFLVDLEGKPVNQELCKGCGQHKMIHKIKWRKRSTYLLKYDAKDKAGNHAEQVVFGLILDDKVRPVITMCGGKSETVEAASSWSLCSTSFAKDNVDGILSKKIKYTVYYGKSRVVNKGSYRAAAKAITTYKTGVFGVRLDVHDNAGVYGHNAKNNNALTKVKGIKVQDTRPPQCILNGASPVVQQCSYKYTDAGATATDLLDTANGRDVTKAIKVTNKVNSNKTGKYTVKYAVSDLAGNAAKCPVRPVSVVDTIKPKIWIRGARRIVHYSGSPFKDPGAKTSDRCDKKLAPYGVRWNRKFNDRKLGDYIRTYSVRDASSNKNTVQRTFSVVDNTKPILKVVGPDVETFEATRDLEYTDKGATCHDYVDGVLSHAVEVSGNVVNMRIPGTYKIRYDCQDLSGNEADKMYRKVVVQDTTCPKIKLNGASLNYVEAGFPYVDAGATATDTLDGEITKKIFKDGDTVNTAQVFYSRQSCREIKAYYKQAQSGEYYITTYNEQKAMTRVLVWCDFVRGAMKTYYPCRNCKRVVPYKKAQGDCAKVGLVMAKGPFSKFVTKKYGVNFFPKKGGSTNSYLCTTFKVHAEHKDHKAANAKDLKRAEAGKYVVLYHVQDKAGNKECKTQRRTVIVKDTLPPVITIHMNRKLVATKSKKANTGHKKTKSYGNPFLKDFMMEETQTSVNGWIVGAVASAVAGVALLGYSMKKSEVTSVPV